MAQETPQGWCRCLESGTAAVQRPYELQQFGPHGVPVLTVYHIPSFLDCFGWTVYQKHGKPDYKLQTIIWKQIADGERIQNFISGRAIIKLSEVAEPTLLESISCIEAKRFDQHIAALNHIKIPLDANRSIGLDGEIFGVRLHGQFELEWWENGPTEWANLVGWTNECIGMFREAMTV